MPGETLGPLEVALPVCPFPSSSAQHSAGRGAQAGGSAPPWAGGQVMLCPQEVPGHPPCQRPTSIPLPQALCSVCGKQELRANPARCRLEF